MKTNRLYTKFQEKSSTELLDILRRQNSYEDEAILAAAHILETRDKSLVSDITLEEHLKSKLKEISSVDFTKDSQNTKCKISSNEYARFVLTIIAGVFISLLVLAALINLGVKEPYLKLILVLITLSYLVVSYILIARTVDQVYWINEQLEFRKNNKSTLVELNKVYSISLQRGKSGSSRPYKIEWTNLDGSYDSKTFFVTRWNFSFESFIDHIKIKHPKVKINRTISSWG